MAEKRKTLRFNKKSCDWRYNAACTADVNCGDECAMPCPYIKDESPCDNCEVKGCDKSKCQALRIYRNRVKENEK